VGYPQAENEIPHEPEADMHIIHRFYYGYDEIYLNKSP
jgi:hypothetical protein